MNIMPKNYVPHRRRRRRRRQPEVVGLFGLPTQKGMEEVMVKKMDGSVDTLKEHVTKQLRVPMLLVSVASLGVILYLVTRRRD